MPDAAIRPAKGRSGFERDSHASRNGARRNRYPAPIDSAGPVVAALDRWERRSRGGGQPDHRRERLDAALYLHDADVGRHRDIGAAAIVACRGDRCDAHFATDGSDPGLWFFDRHVRFRRDAAIGGRACARVDRCRYVYRADRARIAAKGAHGRDIGAHPAQFVRPARGAVRGAGGYVRDHPGTGRDDRGRRHRHRADAAARRGRLWAGDREHGGVWRFRCAVRDQLRHDRPGGGRAGALLWLWPRAFQPAKLDADGAAAPCIRGDGGAAGVFAGADRVRGGGGGADPHGARRTLWRRCAGDAARCGFRSRALGGAIGGDRAAGAGCSGKGAARGAGDAARAPAGPPYRSGAAGPGRDDRGAACRVATGPDRERHPGDQRADRAYRGGRGGRAGGGGDDRCRASPGQCHGGGASGRTAGDLSRAGAAGACGDRRLEHRGGAAAGAASPDRV